MSSRLPTDEALEKEDRIEEMKKNKTKKQQQQQKNNNKKKNKKKKKNSPPVPHLLQAKQVPALPYAKVVRSPGTGSYPAPSPDPATHNLLLLLC